MAGLGPDNSTAATATSTRPGADRRLFGLLLIVFGVLWFLEGVHLLGLSIESLLSIFLITLGAGLIITHHSPGRARLPIILGAVTIVALIANSSTLHLPSVGDVGSHSFRPLTVAELRPAYRIGAGDLSIDLRQLDPAALDQQKISINVGAGHVRVQVPPLTDVVVQSSLGAGHLDVCGHAQDGFGVDNTFDSNPGDGPHLHIDLSGGVGDVRVTGCHRTR